MAKPELQERLLQLMEAEGWDPFNPSEDCATAMARPVLPNRRPGTFIQIDTLGIHWVICTLELIRRFGARAGLNRPGHNEEAFHRAGMLFPMADRLVREPQPHHEAKAAYEELVRWHDTRLATSADLRRRATDEEIIANVDSFEPDLTLALLIHERGFVDVERDRLKAAQGMDMHERNKLRLRPVAPLDMGALCDLFAWVTEERQRPLTKVTSKGTIALVPEKLKTALDGDLGRVITTRHEREIDLPSELDEGSGSSDPLAKMVADEVWAATAAAFRDRLDQLPSGSRRAIAVSNILDRMSGKGRHWREIEREGGPDHSELSRIAHEELDGIRRVLARQ